MGLAELRARTATVPSTKPGASPGTVETVPGASPGTVGTVETPPPPPVKLTGLDLATLAAPAPPQTQAVAPAVDEKKLAGAKGAAAMVAAQGVGAFASMRSAIDKISDIPSRQRAFMRLLETFPSEWVPDAKSRAFYNGTAGVVMELKKRKLWEPWEQPKGAPKAVQLDYAQQDQFISDVLVPCWQKLIDDTANAPADQLAQNVRGLVELKQLWQPLAKGFWRGKEDALVLDDATLLRISEHAPPKEAIAAAATIVNEHKQAAEAIVDRAMPKLDVDDCAKVLFAADRNHAAKALIGPRVETHFPLERWRAWLAEPDPIDVSSWMTRLHGFALTTDHVKNMDAKATIFDAWMSRVGRLDVDDVETAAKVVGLAQSLRSAQRFGYMFPRETLDALPPKVVFQLALMPVAQPAPVARGQKPVIPNDPKRPIREEADQALRHDNAAYCERLFAGDMSADEKRERLKILLGAGSIYSYQANKQPAAVVARVVNELLRDPSTTDAPDVKPPPDHSLQALLMAARSAANTFKETIALDVDALAPFIPQRSAKELAGIADGSWAGDDAAAAARGELSRRLDAGTLEPHEALLRQVFKGAAPDLQRLERWIGAQALISEERHGGAVLAVAQAFGYGGDDAQKDGVAQLIRREFAKLPAPTDVDSVKKMFGLANEIEKKCTIGYRVLLQEVADRSPIGIISAPYADPKYRAADHDVGKVCEVRIEHVTVDEARAYAASNVDVMERIAVMGRVWGGLEGYDAPRAKNAKAILETAMPGVLEELARSGDPKNAQHRQALLFTASAAHAKTKARINVDASLCAPFARECSTKELLQLCLDDALTSTGVRSAAATALEERIGNGGDRVAKLRELLEGWSSLTGSRSSSTSTKPWRAEIEEQLRTLSGAPWGVVWRTLDEASAAALAHDDVGARVDAIVALYPPSRDLNVALAQALRTDRGAVPLSVLRKVDAYDVQRGDSTVLRPDRRLISGALMTHPDGPFALVAHLKGRSTTRDVPPALVDLWRSLDADAQQSVVQTSFRQLFTHAFGPSSRYASSGPKQGDPAAQRKLDDALEKEVFSSLRRDPDLAKLVDRLSPIFSALPRTVQARVATAFALAPPDGNDPPAVLRKLLENAGVVAIKVAQQICEDPEIPARFRDVLESLRDQNLEVDTLGLWSQAGQSYNVERGMESRGYDAVGKRLGTGSVKQANRVVDDGDPKKLPAVLAFVKPGVADEIEESLRALAVDKELAPVVDRVRSMLMRELDLDKEAQAFHTMAEHVQPWPFIRVPKVQASSKEVLLREMSPGMPVSALLRERSLTSQEKQALQDTYRALFQAALDPERFVRGSGFVLTDPHQGNVALDAVDGRVVCDLFDPGQYENLKTEEAALFVRLIVHLSKGNSFWAPKKEKLIESFATLLAKQSARLYNPPTEADIKAKLEEAWKKTAASTNEDSDPGSFLRAWLFAAADIGVPIPDAYFGVAKMLHTIDAQCRDLGLKDVITEEVTRLFKGQLTFKKTVGMLFGRDS